MTQEQMSEHLKVSRMTIIRWETGKAKVPARFDAPAIESDKPQKITPVTYPQLFQWMNKRPHRSPLHPARVLNMNGYEHKDVEWTSDVLASPAYLAALEAAKAALEAAKVADEKTRQWAESTLATMLPGALPGETVAQYNKRTD